MSCDDAQISETDSQCVENAECNLVSGTYTCECEDGYSGDGIENCAPMSCEYTDNGSSQTLPVSTNLIKRVASARYHTGCINKYITSHRHYMCISHLAHCSIFTHTQCSYFRTAVL